MSRRNFMHTETRKLDELISIGPAMLRDFEQLRIRSVAQLARQNPRQLYDRLNHITGQKHDVCVLDVFSAAVAQARNPRDRKSTRLNSSHTVISYAVFCLKKKNNTTNIS